MLKSFEKQCNDKKTRVVEKNVWEEKNKKFHKRNESLKDNIVFACNALKYFLRWELDAIMKLSKEDTSGLLTLVKF